MILENLWQFSKLYQHIPGCLQRYSRYDPTVIWQRDSEIHLTNEGELTDQFYQWRKDGYNNKNPVRYPVGYSFRSNCAGAIYPGTFESDGLPESEKRLPEICDYITSRKQIYIPLYNNFVQKEEQYKELVNELSIGIKLLILEVDGPHQESLDYYINKYKVDETFIVDNTILATSVNLDILLNDPKHPYGHGYCLASILSSLSS